MAEQISPEMLEDLKNDTILPFIEGNYEFPCVYCFRGIANWSEADSPEEIASSFVAWMAHNNWKSARKAKEELSWMSYCHYSEGGAIDAMMEAYGQDYANDAGIVDVLDELDYRGVNWWCETYENNADVIEVINTSSNIEEELPVIVRLLNYDVDGFYSAMNAWRSGVPIEDLIA